MPQTNAEKAEAIARRKQKDRDRADYTRRRTGGYAWTPREPALEVEAVEPRRLTDAEIADYAERYGRPFETRAETIARLRLRRRFPIR